MSWLNLWPLHAVSRSTDITRNGLARSEGGKKNWSQYIYDHFVIVARNIACWPLTIFGNSYFFCCDTCWRWYHCSNQFYWQHSNKLSSCQYENGRKKIMYHVIAFWLPATAKPKQQIVVSNTHENTVQLKMNLMRPTKPIHRLPCMTWNQFIHDF